MCDGVITRWIRPAAAVNEASATTAAPGPVLAGAGTGSGGVGGSGCAPAMSSGLVRTSVIVDPPCGEAFSYRQ